MPGQDGILTSGKDLAGFATELLDSEIQQAYQIIVEVQGKYAGRSASPTNLEMLRDEALTRLAEIGVLATLDPSPCYYGEPPLLEIVGKIAGDPIHTEGFDHEQKGHEVRKSVARGEDYLGQRGEDDGKVAARDRRERNKAANDTNVS